MQKFRFLLPFSDQLEKLQMLTHLDPFDVGTSHGQCIRLVQLYWMFQNEMYILYFMRKFLYDSYYAKVFA